MTLEELKEEAKQQGYALIKIKKREKLLPCTCGSNRRQHWHGVDIKSGRPFEELVCYKCKRRVRGYSKEEAISNWNEMIKKEENHAENRSEE